MKMYGLNEIRNGMKVVIDQDPCAVLENEFVKPGKGQAFNRLRYRNLKTNRVIERTYKSGDSLPAADVADLDVVFLYTDGVDWHFMANNSLEQYAVNSTVLADAKYWLVEQAECKLTLWNSEPILVVPPTFIRVKVTETDPGIRGNTSSGGNKPAKLASGATIRVPLFIQTGEMVKVDTRTGEYVARAEE